MGGKKQRKTTQTYQPPSWVEGASQQAVGIGQRIASQEYTPYSGQRVAGLSENEQMGMSLARESSGIATPYYQEAADLTRQSTRSWADMSDEERNRYMNPYIKGALDPVARELREEGQREAMRLDSRAASMDAFGGSRAALMRSENTRNTLEGISDLYATGMAQAYESAVSLFGQDRAKEMEAAGMLADLGTSMQNAAQTDIDALMTTGATDRMIQQAGLDFNYQQFIEARDWDFRALGGLVGALEGTKGSYTTKQTTETEQGGGMGLAQWIGVAAAVIGAFYTGGATLAAVPSLTEGA